MDNILMSPIFLSSDNHRVTVFGGGSVALRKSRHFEGFKLRIVSESILPQFKNLTDEIVIKKIDKFSIEPFIRDADIVIAATNDRDLNDMICRTSISKGIMTNSANGRGNILIPSTLHRDGFVVAVSSQGNAPVFPPYVIKRIDEYLDSSYDKMVKLLSILRFKVRDKIDTQQDRAKFLDSIINDDEVWNILRSKDVSVALSYCITKGRLQ